MNMARSTTTNTAAVQGLLMMPEPLANAVEVLSSKDRPYDEIIYMTPDGDLLNQHIANSLSLKEEFADHLRTL